MKKIKLAEEELKEAKEIVGKYVILQQEFDDLEKKLKNIETSKNDLLKRMDENRNSEIHFFDDLKIKYGEGNLDVCSMNYILNKKNKNEK